MVRRISRKPKSQIIKWLGIGLSAIFFGGFVMALVSYETRIWNGKERFTRISMGPEIVIESFDPVTLEGTRIYLPAEFQIETTGGRGSWKTGVIPELARKYGEKWAVESVADTLGISYTIYGKLPNWWDKGNWWMWKNKISWKNVRLEDTDAVTEITEADGDKHLSLSEWGKNKIEEWFMSPALAGEGIMVGIINTVGVDGVGNHAARVIGNTGLRVNKVTGSEENFGKCVVESNKDNQKSLTVKWLINTFGCNLKENSQLDKEATLKLGKDYVRWWLGD